MFKQVQRKPYCPCLLAKTSTTIELHQILYDKGNLNNSSFPKLRTVQKLQTFIQSISLQPLSLMKMYLTYLPLCLNETHKQFPSEGEKNIQCEANTTLFFPPCSEDKR